MLAYLNEVLGLSAQEGPWPDAQRLPLYLRGDRDYAILDMDGARAKEDRASIGWRTVFAAIFALPEGRGT